MKKISKELCARIKVHKLVDPVEGNTFGLIFKINNSQTAKINKDSTTIYENNSSQLLNNYVSSECSHIKKGFLVFPLSQTLTDDQNIPIRFYAGHSMFYFSPHANPIDRIAEYNPISWTYFGARGAYFQDQKEIQSRILPMLYPTFSINFGIQDLIFSTFSSQFLIVLDREYTLFQEENYFLDKMKDFKEWFSRENGSKNKSKTAADFLNKNSCGNAILQSIRYYFKSVNADIPQLPLPPFSAQTAIMYAYAGQEIIREKICKNVFTNIALDVNLSTKANVLGSRARLVHKILSNIDMANNDLIKIRDDIYELANTRSHTLFENKLSQIREEINTFPELKIINNK